MLTRRARKHTLSRRRRPRYAATMAQMTTPRPLDGIKIVDFSRYLPGPFASLQLAQLGAEVVAIQQPPGGDLLRAMPPIGPAGVSYASSAMEQGKRVLIADLVNADDLQRVLSECAKADVVIESFRPGVAARLNIGSEQLRRDNPRLVYCSISGYGQTGPWANIPGHDGNFLAATGFLHLNGTPDTPVLPALPIADLAGGSQAATAICAALYQRERTGVGISIDIALSETALALQTHQLPTASTEPTRAAGMLTGGAACYRPYRCKDDRWIIVAAIESKFFHRLCELVEREDLSPLHFNPDEQAHLGSELATLFATRDAVEWAALLAEEHTCVSLLATLEEVVEHPQLLARDALLKLSSQGGAPVPASPFVFDGKRL